MATAKVTITPPVAPSPSAASVAPVAAGRAKKKKLTGAELHSRSEFAKKTTGWSDTNPVFGRKTQEVLEDIDNYIVSGDYGKARELIQHLRVRTAYRQIMFS